MKRTTIALGLLLLITPLFAQQNPLIRIPVKLSKRVEDALKRMTLEEKLLSHMHSQNSVRRAFPGWVFPKTG